MFSSLFRVLIELLPSLEKVKSISDDAQRQKAHVQIFSTYFVLKDLTEDALRLMNSCGWDPVNYIGSLKDEDLTPYLSVCDSILRKQGARLYVLQQAIFSDSCLAFKDYELQKRLREIIGHKSDRVRTLHGAASGLVINAMLVICETPEDRIELILSMSGVDPDAVNAKEIEIEIREFESLLTRYKEYAEQLVEPSNLIKVIEKARSNANG
ncbi:hypothetical protein [Vibrio breoganii]|uniref:hypothetical protein n=1 Tax=Vibrio breoganii TaxID=553239 RepID=UPI001F52CD51|nr:hypothetical protein [Vibrio breoganii]